MGRRNFKDSMVTRLILVFLVGNIFYVALFAILSSYQTRNKSEQYAINNLEEIIKEKSQLISEGFTQIEDNTISLGIWYQKIYINSDEEKYKEIISLKLRELLQDFVKTKVEEGNRLRNFFKEQLNILKLKVEEVKKLKPQVVENYRERLLANVNSVKADIDFKEEDILKEILLFSDRVDITEEVSRLESHLKQLEYEFNVDKDSQGKKIEFIFQEIFREFNTMGVKSNMYEISKLVVEGKNELEKMREQIMNIE